MNKGVQKNKADISKIVNQLVQILTVGGMSNKQIYISLQKKEADPKYSGVKYYDISYRQFEYYLKKAKDEIISKTKESNEYYINRGVRRYDAIYHMAMEQKDLKIALSSQEKLQDLLGLKQATNISVDMYNHTVVDIKTAEQREKALAFIKSLNPGHEDNAT